MKKLLCVLMFGMVFGQDNVSIKEYHIEITSETESINIYDLLGAEATGWYHLDPVYANVNYGMDYDICNDYAYAYGVKLANSIQGEYYGSNLYFGNTNINNNSCNWSANSTYMEVNEQNPTLYVENIGSESNYSFTMVFWISGKFQNDSDVGLQGDMNDDDNLDVLDVVMLVDVIINGGVGDVGDLLNIVTG